MRNTCVFFLALGLSLPAVVLAQNETAEPASVATKEAKHLDIGITALGFVSGNFVAQPTGSNLDIRPFPGFGGVGGGGGVSFSALWRGVVGMELQILQSVEKAKGKITIGQASADISISQSSLHIPILFRLEAPTKSVRPFVFAGPDFVSPGEPEADTLLIGVGAEADDYMAWMFGLGLDIKLDIEGQDIRIPIALHGVMNPSFPKKASELLVLNIPGNPAAGANYRTEWEWQAFVSLGVAYHFGAIDRSEGQ
jgi:hypothetical protein